MVGNFREGFIFASQEPSAKIKTTKICCPRAKRTNRVSIPSLLGTIYIAAKRSVLASVPLTAITEATRKSKCYVRTDARNRQLRKVKSGNNRYYERPSLASQTLSVPQRRSLSVCGTLKRSALRNGKGLACEAY